MPDSNIPHANGHDRAAAVETNLFALGITEMENNIRARHPDAEAALALALAYREHNRVFANLGIYRQRLAREFERTLILLRQIQVERRTNEERQLDDAAMILKMHQDANLPCQPSDDGFVFSKPKSRPTSTAKNAGNRPLTTTLANMPRK